MNQISRNKSRNKSLFNQLGHRVNAASRKSLEIQEKSITKLNQEPIRSKNVYEN